MFTPKTFLKVDQISIAVEEADISGHLQADDWPCKRAVKQAVERNERKEVKKDPDW